MLDFILDPINEFIRDMLKGWIEDNLSDLFVQLNDNVAGVTTEVSQTPSTWNGSIFSIVQNLSETVIVPIAAVIITYVLCYELISMLIDRNNMHDFDTALFLKYIFKAGIAVFLLSIFEKATGGDTVFQISFHTAVLAALLLAVLGALAGLAPALRAMAVKPVDAMSDE